MNIDFSAIANAQDFRELAAQLRSVASVFADGSPDPDLMRWQAHMLLTLADRAEWWAKFEDAAFAEKEMRAVTTRMRHH